MTISHALQRATLPKSLKPTSQSLLKRPQIILSQNSQSSFRSRNMNTLQEASRIYKAFQKGRPTFGGWQVSHPEDETKLDVERLTAL
ncbi:hypothetical protein IG631_16688 [Alternaria alternata]|nr:hypothetical protein IG631_16688 [Alternaria alternata]